MAIKNISDSITKMEETGQAMKFTPTLILIIGLLEVDRAMTGIMGQE
jgi:hypothetical protein